MTICSQVIESYDFKINFKKLQLLEMVPNVNGTHFHYLNFVADRWAKIQKSQLCVTKGIYSRSFLKLIRKVVVLFYTGNKESQFSEIHHKSHTFLLFGCKELQVSEIYSCFLGGILKFVLKLSPKVQFRPGTSATRRWPSTIACHINFYTTSSTLTSKG